MAAATGFFSTAEDLCVFGSAHVLGDDRLLTDDSKRLMQRLESVVTAYGTEVGRYGIGMVLKTVGERQLVGHSGGYPGHSTLTLLDPVAGLVVSVLTNAVDGPAEDLVVGLVELIDVALTPRAEVPAPPAGTPPLASFTGRFVGLWGVLDVAELGGRLVLVRTTLPRPLPGIEELEVVDAHTLRVAAQPSFGPAGELVPLERDAAGRVVSLRYRRRDQPAGRGRPPPSVTTTGATPSGASRGPGGRRADVGRNGLRPGTPEHAAP